MTDHGSSVDRTDEWVAMKARHLRPLGERPESWRAAERALDQIASRFGTEAVRPAALVDGHQAPREDHDPPPSRPGG